jgi:hypothetical protein
LRCKPLLLACLSRHRQPQVSHVLLLLLLLLVVIGLDLASALGVCLLAWLAQLEGSVAASDNA